MSIDLSAQFRTAIHLAQSGQKTEALIQLRRLLIQQPDHVMGLMWLSGLSPDPHEGIAALEKVLGLNPTAEVAEAARQGMTTLRNKIGATATSAPASPSLIRETPAEKIVTLVPIESELITKARAVIWPFRKLNRPIGELLDAGTITLKDLKWASGPKSYAKDDVRQAAQTLVDALEVPTTTVEITPLTPALAEAINEARAVLWPYRRMHRPMGQLLDEGKITAKDLDYAVRRGHATVRLAASILLKTLPPDVAAAQRLAESKESTETAPTTELTLTEAQAMPWPYNKSRLNQRPMGQLLVEGKISLKDLQYAIDRASDEAIVEAAQLLLDHAQTEAAIKAEATGELDKEALNQVELKPSFVPRADGSLVVLGSSNYLSRGKLIGRLKTLAGMLFSDNLFDEGVKDYSSFKAGERGEDEVVAELKRLLDNRWRLFRNAIVPGSDADLDAVLVGPTGVLVLEIKAYSGSFRVRGSEWQYRSNNNWRPVDRNPIKQAVWNRQRLARYLNDKHPNEDVSVSVLLVLGREPQYIQLIKPAVYVATRPSLIGKSLAAYLAQPLLPDRTVQAVMRTVEKITTL